MAANTAQSKRKLTVIDVFLIVGALLVLIAIVGQDVAVYFINRRDRAERFEVSFTLRSVESSDAEALVAARLAVDEMTVQNDGKTLGSVKGGLTISQAENDHLSSVTGTLSAVGRTKEGVCYIYGFDKPLRVGDRMYVIFEADGGSASGKGYTLEVTAIAQVGEST